MYNKGIYLVDNVPAILLEDGFSLPLLQLSEDGTITLISRSVAKQAVFLGSTWEMALENVSQMSLNFSLNNDVWKTKLDELVEITKDVIESQIESLDDRTLNAEYEIIWTSEHLSDDLEKAAWYAISVDPSYSDLAFVEQAIRLCSEFPSPDAIKKAADKLQAKPNYFDFNLLRRATFFAAITREIISLIREED